ncbi:hypothetical protein MicloDRAFT_00005350 [Microvirga lotononidis]|uniref:Uncharacterized protein n=1 Tax=Microvirga lotononidis TaxID=864069 RepID=I4Z340_9HYPH|nr:hypothetical protein MicloDRAFT_00005350 [Microvirga lotononidis]
MLTAAQWAMLEPLVEQCRPKGKTPPQDLRRTIEAMLGGMRMVPKGGPSPLSWGRGGARLRPSSAGRVGVSGSVSWCRSTASSSE